MQTISGIEHDGILSAVCVAKFYVFITTSCWQDEVRRGKKNGKFGLGIYLKVIFHRKGYCNGYLNNLCESDKKAKIYLFI